MFEELKKYAMKKVLKRAAICGGIAVLLIVVFFSGFLKFAQGPVDLFSLSKEQLLGSYVEADIYALFDSVATYTRTEDGRTTDKKDYYVLPLPDGSYIALEVDSDDYKKADKILNETYEYLMGTRDELTSTYYFKGSIRKMDKELLDYYNDWFVESGFSSEEIESYALPYVLDADYIGRYDASLVIAALLSSGGLIIYVIIILIKGATGAYLNSIKSFIRKNQDSISAEEVEREYYNAESIENVKVSKSYTFYFKGPKISMVKNDDVIWAYLRRVTHRTNGIKTHVTKSLMLHTYNKNQYQIDMSSEEAVHSVLNVYAMKCPHIVLGYSEDLRKCYKKDFDAFLRISQNAQQSAATSGTQYTVSSDSKSGNARVILHNSGENAIHVIKAIRENLECGLKEAKDLVDNTPSVLKENISMEAALAFKAELESLGASVEVNQAG